MGSAGAADGRSRPNVQMAPIVPRAGSLSRLLASAVTASGAVALTTVGRKNRRRERRGILACLRLGDRTSHLAAAPSDPRQARQDGDRHQQHSSHDQIQCHDCHMFADRSTDHSRCLGDRHRRQEVACPRGCRPRFATPTLACGLPGACCPKLVEHVDEPVRLADSHGQLGMTNQPDQVETLDRSGKRDQDPSRAVCRKR
jgi:hypothetical protein